MKFSLLIMALVLTTLTFAQTRTTRDNRTNPIGPDATGEEANLFKTASDSAEATVGLVKLNMRTCLEDKKAIDETNHIKDAYALIQALQFANVLEGWKSLKFTNYRNESCELGNHDYVSPKVRCLLRGTEGTLSHFVSQKDAVNYLMKTSMTKEEAIVMIQDLRRLNELMIKELEINPSKYHLKLNKVLNKNINEVETDN